MDSSGLGMLSLLLPIAIAAFVVIIAIVVLMVVSMWKIFEKAGEKGWCSLIPFYNSVKLLEITRKPLWWVILLLIPIVNIFIGVIISNRLSRIFGHGKWFTVGIIFLPFIFLPILAFGASRYNNEYPPAPAMSEATKWALIPVVGILISWYSVSLFSEMVPSASPGLHPLTQIAGDDGDQYVTDGRYIYDGHEMVSGADPDSFKPLVGGNGQYATDAYAVYYNGTTIPGADPNTFTILQGEYASDATHDYYSALPITGAEVSSFKVLDPDYAIDDNHAYYDGTVISGADPTTLVALGNYSGYASDADTVYYSGTSVSGADPKTFMLATDPSGNENYDAKDKNHYYSSGQIVQP